MFKTRVVNIGNIPMGGDHPIRLQSMTNTPTTDTEATVKQVIRIIKAGADYVRISTPSVSDAMNLENIKQRLHELGFDNPLIADIHFNPKVAEVAAKIADKIRINPGNFSNSKDIVNREFKEEDYNRELQNIREKLIPIIKICKTFNTAIRIGVNHGSLSSRILYKYGDTPEGMVESAIEYLKICGEEDFHNIVLSMKSSNTRLMVYASRLLVKRMIKERMDYPQHLGVTEAGEGEDGRIKSAVGIGTLLADGIGDTIRVSLTEAPEDELPVAKNILNNINQGKRLFKHKEDLLRLNTVFKQRQVSKIAGIESSNLPVVVGNDISERNVEENTVMVYNGQSFKDISLINNGLIIFESGNYTELRDFLDSKQIKVPVIVKLRVINIESGSFLVEAAVKAGRFFIDNTFDGIWLTVDKSINKQLITDVALSILQASGSRYTRPEYISCPTCSRTGFNIQKAVQEIKERTRGMKGVKIAIMGCIVNGPGEMADADFGYVGSGKGVVTLYKGKKVIEKNIPEEQAIDKLISIIKSMD